ncbi:MAG: transporter permease [Gemmatimonadetes bacterium]|nr:transporter permease [Gemmatimonadota bacterium]
MTHDPYAALRHRDYRWFIVSYFTMTLASQVQGVVVAWQIYAITHDPLSLGLIGLAEALPFVSTSLFAGHVADRADRKRIALLALATLVVCAIALLVLARMPAAWHARGAWPFYAVIFASGIARAFLAPARQALGADIIPREFHANAVAWRSSSWQSAAVVGPALGGLLYGFSSATVAYAAVVVLMAVALFSIFTIEYRWVPTHDASEGMRESLSQGVRFVRTQPVILGAMTLDLFSVLLGGAEALLPVFADRILHVGPQGLGILRAAPAAGAVAMSFWLAHRPPMQRAGRALLFAVAGFALCIIGFGVSTSFWLSLVLLAVSGMLDNVSVLVRSTLLQLLTPPELMGRVSAVNQVFIGSSNELGAFESGVAARLLGVVPSVVLGGVASLAVVGLVGWKVPALRDLRKLSG